MNHSATYKCLSKVLGKNAVVSWVWWYMLVIAALRRLRQEQEFKASVGQIVKLP